MELLYHFIRDHTLSLYQPLYSADYFFVDRWSIIHYASGFFLFLLYCKYTQSARWVCLPTLLIAYEILEIWFIYASINVFLPESLPDQVTDIIFGCLGGMTGELYCQLRLYFQLNSISLRMYSKTSKLLLSFCLSFIWVRFYGYQYNFDMLNSPIVNWWALMLWTIGIRSILWAYSIIRCKGIYRVSAVFLVWCLYVTTLFGLEFVGYVLLGIRETGGHPPLAFGLVHGTTVLKTYYLLAPPLILLIAYFSRTIADRMNLISRLAPAHPHSQYSENETNS